MFYQAEQGSGAVSFGSIHQNVCTGRLKTSMFRDEM